MSDPAGTLVDRRRTTRGQGSVKVVRHVKSGGGDKDSWSQSVGCQRRFEHADWIPNLPCGELDTTIAADRALMDRIRKMLSP